MRGGCAYGLRMAYSEPSAVRHRITRGQQRAGWPPLGAAS